MVEIELPDLERARKELAAFPGGADFAITHTLNDVAASGKAAATQFIFVRYQFDTQGPLQRGIKLKKVSSSHQLAVIRFQGSRFPIKQFLPSRTESGIDFMEIRGQRSNIAHAFAAVMQYGFGVFKRESPHAPRWPVRSVTGRHHPETDIRDARVSRELPGRRRVDCVLHGRPRRRGKHGYRDG